MFNLTTATLERLMAINSFAPGDDVVMFGLRGALPVNQADAAASGEKAIDVADVDHAHPRCTIGLWWRGDKQLACFPGSTVPFLGAIKEAQAKGGQGANRIMTSLIGFAIGRHPRSAEANRQHDAFVQDGEFAVQRTADDLDYDAADPVTVGIVGDNLHCAFCQSAEQEFRSSFGCQVVVGFAKRAAVAGSVDAGPWKRFRDHAYAVGQKRFRYALLRGADAQVAAVSPPRSIPARLRYGSTGELVTRVQKTLSDSGHLAAAPKGVFERETLFAVMAFQRAKGFVPDGVVGQNTVDALKLAKSWPLL